MHFIKIWNIYFKHFDDIIIVFKKRQNQVSETLCVLNKNRMMHNVQKRNICINIPSSQNLYIIYNDVFELSEEKLYNFTAWLV
jgi:hypothetical protein